MDNSVGRLVSILYRKNQVYLNEALKELGLTASELPIIIYVLKHDGVSQEEMAQFLSIDKAAIARAVDTLLEKGLVQKEKDEQDRRANKITVTEVGKKIEFELSQRLLYWTQYLTKDIEEKDLDTMYRVLNIMVDKLEHKDCREIWGNHTWQE
jgi:MarR family transcriptional regulator, organic hydroperoxide resistance regulator